MAELIGANNIVSTEKFVSATNVSNKASSGKMASGTTVSLAPNLSSIQEQALRSLEELSLAGSQRSHRRHTQKQRNSQRSKLEFKREQIDKLRKSSLPIKKLQEVDSLINQLKQKKQDLKNFKEWLNEFSQDKTEKYVALLSMRQQLAEEPGNEVALRSIQEAIDMLSNSQEVKVGTETLNIMALAAEHGFDHEDLRRQAKFKGDRFNTASKALAWLKNSFGDKRFVKATKNVYREISNQYHAHQSNIDDNQLMTLLQEMSMLKTMMAAYDQCLEAMYLFDDDAFEDRKYRGFKLFEAVLGLQSKSWVEQHDIKKIAEIMSIEKLGDLNTLAVQVKRIISLFPEHIYHNDGQKQQCLDTLSDYLDCTARQEHANV